MKSNITNKIKSLLQKTVENGATQEDDINAMQIVRKSTPLHDRSRFCHVGLPVSAYTETTGWRNLQQGMAYFCGLEADVDFAISLYNSLRTAHDMDYREYTLSLDYQIDRQAKIAPSTLKANFTAGFIVSIAERLKKLKASRKKNAATTQRIAAARGEALPKNALTLTEVEHSKNLEPVKANKISLYMLEAGLKIKPSRISKLSAHSEGATQAGIESAKNASLNQKINGA